MVRVEMVAAVGDASAWIESVDSGSTILPNDGADEILDARECVESTRGIRTGGSGTSNGVMAPLSASASGDGTGRSASTSSCGSTTRRDSTLDVDEDWRLGSAAREGGGGGGGGGFGVGVGVGVGVVVGGGAVETAQRLPATRLTTA